MKNRSSPLTIAIRLILSLCLATHAVPPAAWASSALSIRVKPVNAGVPAPINVVSALPDFDAPEAAGKVKLSWSAPADSDGRSVFSYIVKYATFPVSDLAGDTTAWWNHPSVITALEASLPAEYGRAAKSPPGLQENINISGLAPGDYYYFAVKIVDRYNRRSDWDAPYRGVAAQSRAFATTPPWMPAKVTNLAASALEARTSVRLEWTAPVFLDELSQQVPGKIKQLGYYCVQYATSSPPGVINKPNQPNNWSASYRHFVSTQNVSSGDDQSYVLTGLSQNTTYYIHLFTRNEWPNKWSSESAPVTLVVPYVHLDPVDSFTASAAASADDDIASYVALTWRSPPDEEFYLGTRVNYSTSAYPSSPPSGAGFDVEPLAVGETTGYAHVRLLPRTTYYYSAWAYDVNRLYSEARYASVYTGDDLTAPTSVKNITSFVEVDRSGVDDAYNIRMSWTPPDLPLYRNMDYRGVRIYYSTSSGDASSHQYLASVENLSYAHLRLEPYATYYYSLASYDTVGNEQSVSSRAAHAVFISENYVPPAPPTIITHLYSASKDYADGCKVALTWQAPPDAHFAKIVAKVGYDTWPLSPAEGETLREWTGLPSQSASDEFKRLVSLTTNYISLFALSNYGIPSRPAKMSVFADVPWVDTVAPMAPRDIRISPSGRISWSRVKYDENLKPIQDYASPAIDEIYYYEVAASTSMNGSWEVLARALPSASYADLPPDSGGYFKVCALDASRNCADSYASDFAGNVYVVADDASHVVISSEAAPAVRSDDSAAKDAYVMTLSRSPSDEKGIIYKSLDFNVARINETADSLSLENVPNFSFKTAGARVAFSYDASGGKHANASPAAAQSPAPALGVFYYNGAEWQRINLASYDGGFVKSEIRFSGKYHLRYASPAGDFAFYDAVPRVITPNGDGLNDRAMFRFANPKAQKITLEIYDVNSALVRKVAETTLSSDVPGSYIYWDGAGENGKTVGPGVYVYQMDVDGKIINGTIVVAR